MYRIIGIIALVGTLAGCPNPATQQPDSKTFDGEYKIILQSGPFRGPLEVWYGRDGRNTNRDTGSVTVTTLPWRAEKRETVSSNGQGGYLPITLVVSYSKPTGVSAITGLTTYRLEIWTDGQLRKDQIMTIDNDSSLKIATVITNP